MKKIIGVGITTMSIFFLTGCSGSVKKDFATFPQSVMDKHTNSGDFNLTLENINMDTEEEDIIPFNIGLNTLKNSKLMISYVQDSKEKDKFDSDVVLETLGTKIPFNIKGQLSENPQLFLSTSFITSALKIAQSFGPIPGIDTDEIKSLKNKHISVAPFEDAKKELSDDQTDSMKQAIKLNDDFSKSFQKEYQKYIVSLPKETFKKDEKEITHTFKKNEIIDLMKLQQKVIDSNDKFSKIDLDDLDTMIKDLNKFKELSLTLSVNNQKMTYKGDLHITFNSPDENGSVSTHLSFDGKNNKEPISIELPSKDEVVSEKELSKLVSKKSSPALNSTLSDDDYEQLKKDMKDLANSDTLTKDEISEILTSSKIGLSPDQKKELLSLFENKKKL